MRKDWARETVAIHTLSMPPEARQQLYNMVSLGLQAHVAGGIGFPIGMLGTYGGVVQVGSIFK